MGDPRVTVVIPTRDRWPRLESTLRGALAQEGVSLELIVVDDGSTDQTPARLAEVEDSRLRVLRQESSRGVAVARTCWVLGCGAAAVAVVPGVEKPGRPQARSVVLGHVSPRNALKRGSEVEKIIAALGCGMMCCCRPTYRTAPLHPRAFCC